MLDPKIISKTDELRKKRNDVSLEIAQKKKAGQDSSPLLEMMKEVSQKLEEMEETQNKVELDYKKLALTIPNLIHESVPIGADQTANKEIKKWGEPPRLDFKVQDHVDFSTSLDLVDLERAAKVAGARFYFLKNDFVQLNQA